MSKFDGQVVVVTGGAGSLGAAVAQRFHDDGATVAVLDIVTPEGAPYASYATDLIDPATAQAGFANVANAHGPVDVLANIAGGFTMGDSIVETSDATWDFMFNLNARTVLNAARAVVPSMQERGRGKIVNIGARAALRGDAIMGAYCASKSVVLRLTETLSAELKEHGVNVNCILPSIIDTPRNREDMPKSDHSRWVRPEQIADIIAFLASPQADAIHGASIPVEGLS